MTQGKSSRKKMLTISDAISAQTGLGRIHRDLVTRIVDNLSDVYEVATMGYGGVGTSKIKVPQYPMEGMDSWVLPSLPDVCRDFFGEDKATILVISDAHRWTWLASPRGANELYSKFPGLQQWAMSRPFDLWGYLPVDSSGPNDRLTFPIMKTLLGFDRLIAYGSFGEGVIRRTIGDEEADKRHLGHLPHGIDSSTFYEQDRKLSRRLFLQYTGARSFFEMVGVPNAATAPIADDEILIHLVGTNQFRKDWCTGLECCAILARDTKIRVWVHCDDLERHWSIPNLLADFGLLDKTVISLGQIADDRMAVAYSAADLGLGIGLGEGYGYTIMESLFCGTPCLHVNYGGAPQWMASPELLVEPVAYRYEGSYASQRPVCSAQDWANKANEIIGKRVNHNDNIDWERLWPARWEPYLREAAK